MAGKWMEIRWKNGMEVRRVGTGNRVGYIYIDILYAFLRFFLITNIFFLEFSGISNKNVKNCRKLDELKSEKTEERKYRYSLRLPPFLPDNKYFLPRIFGNFE